MALKAHGNEVVGSIHVKKSNTWLRMKLTPAWFCAKGLVYERKANTFVHVATVRLCHRKKEHCVLWQVLGPDLSRSLPQEALLWTHQ